MTTKLAQVNTATEIHFDIGLMPNIRREDPKIVWEGLFDPELTKDTWIDIGVYSDQGVEILKKVEDHLRVEIIPTFNGGDPNVLFYRYILQNLKYPEMAVKNRISGKVIVKFVVNSTGSIERA